MTEQTKAKKAQQYHVPGNCKNCTHLTGTEQPTVSFGVPTTRLTGLVCGLGGFKVTRKGTCSQWLGKGAPLPPPSVTPA